MELPVLKVEWKDELRRIALEPGQKLSLAALTTKLGAMFSLCDESFSLAYRDTVQGPLVPLLSDEDCEKAFRGATQKHPPILRIVISAPAEVLAVPSVSEETKIICDVCLLDREGPYYKCINCLEFEMCEECELKGSHNEGHLLVKLRKPLSSFPLKQQLIFKDHVEDQAQKLLAREQKRLMQQQAKEAALERKKRKEEERRRKLEEKAKKLVEKKVRAQRKKTKGKPKKTSCAVATVEDPASCVAADTPSDLNVSQLLTEFQLVPRAGPENTEILDEDVLTEVAIWESSVVETNLEEKTPAQEQPQEQKPLEEEKTSAQEQPQEQKPLEEEKSPVEQPQDQKPSHPFKQKLELLADMGFSDTDTNIKLLIKNVGDLEATVEQLLHQGGKNNWPNIFSFAL